MKSREELNESIDGLMIIIQAAARTMIAASSVSPLLITYEGHPARHPGFTSPGARDGGPTLAERVARRHGRRLDRVSGQCASSNMSFVRNQVPS